MGFGNAVIYSILGILVVFFALILLMLITKLMTKVIPAEEKKTVADKKENIPMQNKENQTNKQLAPGSAGEIKLHGVDPRDAAMCMAIVADKLGKPINELKFISIKEIEG